MRFALRRRSRSPRRSADDRAVAARERAELDVRYVVLEAPAVREAGEVAAERAEAVARADRGGRRNPVFSRIRSACAAREVQAGHAGEQHGDEVPRPVVGASSSTG